MTLVQLKEKLGEASMSSPLQRMLEEEYEEQIALGNNAFFTTIRKSNRRHKYGELDPTLLYSNHSYPSSMMVDLDGALLWLNIHYVESSSILIANELKKLVLHLLSYPVMIWDCIWIKHSVDLPFQPLLKTSLRLWSASTLVIQIMVGLSLGLTKFIKKKLCWCSYESRMVSDYYGNHLCFRLNGTQYFLGLQQSVHRLHLAAAVAIVVVTVLSSETSGAV